MRIWLLAALGTLLAIVAFVSVGLYGGFYNVAANIPHTAWVYSLLQTVRDRSIAVRAADIVVPNDLSDPKRIVSGAGQYAEMCSNCHLAPGKKRTEISRGLYPRAPALRRGSRSTPAEDFWVVKNGIKMTGMPAWGVTHDDKILWDMVAFLRKLPELTADQYRALVENSPKTHHETMQESSTHNRDSANLSPGDLRSSP
jgi:mono/diheme cytochrome c family protein